MLCGPSNAFSAKVALTVVLPVYEATFDHVPSSAGKDHTETVPFEEVAVSCSVSVVMLTWSFPAATENSTACKTIEEERRG